MIPGMYKDMSNADYHSDNGFYSSSALKLLLKEPEAFYRQYIKKEKQKDVTGDHFDIGTAIHTSILEPDKFADSVAFFDGIKRGKAFDQFKEANPGKIILGNLAQMQIERMAASVKASSGNKFVTGGQSEISLFTELEGTKIKVRADHMKAGEFICDLKSMGGIITEKAFMAQCERFGYDLSAALYLDAFNEELQKPHEFYFVVTSKEYDDTKTFRCSPEFLEQGRRKYKEAIRLLKQYEAANWEFKDTIIELKPLRGEELDLAF